MATDDFFTFTATPALEYCVQQLAVNLKNMYDYVAAKSDIRTVVSMLLKIHLAPDNYFRNSGRNPEDTPSNGLRHTKNRENSKEGGSLKQPKKTLYDLEKAVCKEKHNIPLLKKFIEDVFLPKQKSSTATKTKAKKERIHQKSNGTDTPASYIRALTAALTMLCMSPSVNGVVSPEYVKKTIYKDKRDKITYETYELCSRIINTIRGICIKNKALVSIEDCIGIRHIRNTLVEYSKSKQNYDTKPRRISVERSKEDMPLSVKVDARTLYLIFRNVFIMYKNKAHEQITNVQDISDVDVKECVFSNFFRTNHVNRLLMEQRLRPKHYMIFTNQYQLHFAGYRIWKRQLPKEAHSSTGCSKTIKKRNTTEVEEEVKHLDDDISKHKLNLASLREVLNQQESRKLELRKAITKKKKEDGYVDQTLVKKLNQEKIEYNKTWTLIMDTTRSIKTKKTTIYCLQNPCATQESSASSTMSTVRDKVLSLKEDQKVVVSGLDPGIVSTAVISTTLDKTLYSDINRFMKSDTQFDSRDTSSLNVKPRYINSSTFLTAHRQKTEAGFNIGAKKRQRNAVTRKIRTDKFFKKLYSAYRKKVCDEYHGAMLINFVGNWGGASNVKGERRSTKSLFQRMKSLQNDKFVTLDEYNTTVTCSSCFGPTVNQKVLSREEKWVTLKGAVVCYNDKCPRRLIHKQTTINRDFNGAYNISLSGFSRLMSMDGYPLPVFSRSQKSNSYKLHPSVILPN